MWDASETLWQGAWRPSLRACGIEGISRHLLLSAGLRWAHGEGRALRSGAEGIIMSVEQNLETVRRGYVAFSNGDMDTLMTLYDDDAVHLVPGASQVSGAHKGKESILGLYGKLFELSGGSLRVQLEHLLSDGGNRVVAIHTSSMEKDAETFTQTEALLFSLVNGKVAEIQDFFADIPLNDRLFS